MKLKCSKCGKKEAELMSKAEIKSRRSNFASPALAEKLLDIADDWLGAKYIVCTACGYYEKQ